MIDFATIWAVDFEYIAQAGSGERPLPVCVTATELRSGRTVQAWHSDMDHPPYPTDSSALFVCYFARAELSCHAALGWPMPARVCDLGVEFRRLTNGLGQLPHGRGLLGALLWYGLDAMNAIEKREMVDLILRGGPWSRAEQQAILAYNKRDVDALVALFPKMIWDIVRRPGDLKRALLRGRYGPAVARIEHAGVPISLMTFERLRRHWTQIQAQLVSAVDPDYRVYDGMTFKTDRFVDYLARHRIPWPLTEKGQISLDSDAFRERARAFPQLYPLYELRHTMGQLRLGALAVGQDGRNRTAIWPFAAKTGRNQPSNDEFVFGPSRWIRHLIKPEPGKSLAYIDWKYQEIGIAAALSGDEAMLEAVRSGDPYLKFAITAGLAPLGATKRTHPTVRSISKECMLGTDYGMGANALAFRIGRTVYEAKDLLARHRAAYPVFWRWSDANVDYALQFSELETVFGWRFQVTDASKPTSLRNWPMQSNGSELLRLACCLATERGITVVAPVHDAVMIEADEAAIDEAVATTQAAMAEASQEVLGGFELATEVDQIAWPQRYTDERGAVMWERIMTLLTCIESTPGSELHL